MLSHPSSGQPSALPAQERVGIAAYFQPRVAALACLGFSSGLPFLLIFATLSLWLREAGVERGAATYFSWAALGYSFKFVWAPVIDRLPPPFGTHRLGRRRGWLLLAQLAVVGAIVGMALSDPAAPGGLTAMAVAAVALGFASATQDIVIDAYRIEVAAERLQAILASAYVAGYRGGMLVSGALALYLATWFGSDAGHYDYAAWRHTYLCMAVAMAVGLATTLIIREPATVAAHPPRRAGDHARFVLLFALVAAAFVAAFAVLGEDAERLGDALAGTSAPVAGFLAEAIRFCIALALAVATGAVGVRLGVAPPGLARDAYIAPVADFFRRHGRGALVVLLLVGFYRVSDIVLGVVANIFYFDMGYSKEAIATATKVFGIWMTLLGGFLGGWLALRLGVMRVLMLGAVLTVATNLLFILLAQAPGNLPLLYAVIGADNLTAGLASAAFVAYLASLTSLSFTAVQYAILSSLMTLFPKVVGGYSGQMVDAVGYSSFFLGAAAIGVPVFFLVALAARHRQAATRTPAAPPAQPLF